MVHLICFSLADHADAHGLWNAFQSKSLYISLNFQRYKKEFIIDKKKGGAQIRPLSG